MASLLQGTWECPVCHDTNSDTTSCSHCLSGFLKFLDKYVNNLPYGIKPMYFRKEDYREVYKVYFPNGIADEEGENGGRELTQAEKDRIDAVYKRVRARQDEREGVEQHREKARKTSFARMDPRRFG